MSRLTPNLIVLDKGLNLQTPKITAPEGSALDSLNYEQVDFQGQKRIDGYLRYDGQLPSDLTDYQVLSIEPTGGFPGGLIPEFEVGSLFQTDKGLYGIVLFCDATGDTDSNIVVHLAVFNYNAAPVIGQVDATIGTTVADNVLGSTLATPDEHYTNLLAYNDILRDLVTQLPGPVAGLHWFRDRLYAVASVPGIIVAGDGDYPDIHATDSITVGSSEDRVTVLQVYQIPNTLKSLVFLDIMDYENLNDGGDGVDKDGNNVGTTVARDLGLVPRYDMASFYVARNEQQVLEEDGDGAQFGWKHLPTGWVVHFENGNSLFGSLTAINQHPSNEGEAASTDPASSGKPLILVQDVEISNLPEQVNGWKVSTSPTVYSLEVGALESVDDYSIYADAFISWEDGEVIAPGADGVALVEYSPTAKVEVDV